MLEGTVLDRLNLIFIKIQVLNPAKVRSEQTVFDGLQSFTFFNLNRLYIRKITQNLFGYKIDPRRKVKPNRFDRQFFRSTSGK
jgi:hypothetical protein